MGTSLLFKYGFGSGKKRVAIRVMSCKWCKIFSHAKDFVGGMHSQIERLGLRLVQRHLWQNLKFPLLSPYFAPKQTPLDPTVCQVLLVCFLSKSYYFVS